MRARLYCLALLAALFAAGCASNQPKPAPPTLAEIVELSRNHVPPEQIVQRLKDSKAVYDLSGSQYARLHEQGVPESVLNYMQQAQLEAARRQSYSSRPGVFGSIWGGSGGSGVGIGVGF